MVWFPTPRCQGTGEMCGSDTCERAIVEPTMKSSNLAPKKSHKVSFRTVVSPNKVFPFTVPPTPQPDPASSAPAVTDPGSGGDIVTFTVEPTSTSTTTTPTTSTTTTTTTTTTPDPLASCATRGSSSEDIFMWLEWPSLPNNAVAWTEYYSTLASFMDQNCARLRVTKMVLRITEPRKAAWWSPDNSPLYLALLSHIDPATELYVYPYVMDAYNQGEWTSMAPSGSNIVEGIFEFVKTWNVFLAAQGSGLRFSGAVFDYEEFMNNRNPMVLAQVQNMQPLKDQYNLKTAITFGYQSSNQMRQWDSVMDDFYLQFYDYYYEPYVNAGPNSPFLLYKNDPATLAQFTLETVLQGYSESTDRYGPKVNVMWSLQSMEADCIYPLNDGTCGINHEFGSGWTAAAFNQYLKEFRARSPNLGSKPQGLFQYSFMPVSWFRQA